MALVLVACDYKLSDPPRPKATAGTAEAASPPPSLPGQGPTSGLTIGASTTAEGSSSPATGLANGSTAIGELTGSTSTGGAPGADRR